MDSRLRWVVAICVAFLGGAGAVLLLSNPRTIERPDPHLAKGSAEATTNASQPAKSPTKRPDPLEAVPLPEPARPIVDATPEEVESADFAAWREEQRRTFSEWGNWSSELCDPYIEESLRFDPQDFRFRAFTWPMALEHLDQTEWNVYETWRKQRYAEAAGFPINENEWPTNFRQDLALLSEAARASATRQKRYYRLHQEVSRLGKDAPKEIVAALKEATDQNFSTMSFRNLAPMEDEIRKRYHINDNDLFR